MSFETLAMREFARNAGHDRPEAAWILTPFDSWEPNPFYQGPAVRHPEDADCDSYDFCPITGSRIDNAALEAENAARADVDGGWEDIPF